MSEMLTTKFCGNPRNHGAHAYQSPGWGYFHCDGVDREEVSETIVEKFEPTVTEAADGTEYSKITIIIENANGDATVIQVPKGSHIELENHYKDYHFDIADLTKDIPGPELEYVEFTFVPNKENDTTPSMTVERVEGASSS